MTKIRKTESEILDDLNLYIASNKRNRPSVLAPIKREDRTQKICDLVFANPRTFKLETEIKYVPVVCLTQEILIKLILDYPNNIELLDEDLISIQVMVAFEFAKRRFEHLSSRTFGIYGSKFKVPQKIYEVRDSVSNLCDELEVKYNDIDILSDYELYINKVAKSILNYFKEKDYQELAKTKKVHIKYRDIKIPTDKKVLILISGSPDSGKTTFSYMLKSQINDSFVFDSDNPRDLSTIKSHVIIFSDLNSENCFSEEEKEKYHVINIIITPCSIEKMYRNAKNNQRISFNDWLKYEARDPYYEGCPRDITVINDYDERLWTYVDKTLEDIAFLLDFSLPQPNKEKKLERLN